MRPPVLVCEWCFREMPEDWGIYVKNLFAVALHPGCRDAYHEHDATIERNRKEG